MKSLGMILPLAMFVAHPCAAADDTFLQAVSFALTGNDGSQVQVIDRVNCVFGINQGDADEVFHLNNVDVDRIAIQGWLEKSVVNQRYVTVELHGPTTVYENTSVPARLPKDFEDDLRTKGIVKQDYYEPRHISSTGRTLRLYTAETERVIRAWKYIYAHGCKGRKSNF
jgi:hypothetical protein